MVVAVVPTTVPAAGEIVVATGSPDRSSELPVCWPTKLTAGCPCSLQVDGDGEMAAGATNVVPPAEEPTTQVMPLNGSGLSEPGVARSGPELGSSLILEADGKAEA